MNAVVLLLLLAAEPGEWEEIEDKDGIKVWQRESEGSSLVEFKGQARIDASIKKVLAVLHDQKRKTEWLARCRENRLVRAKSVGVSIIYNRVRSDFPLVDDRDVVFQTKVQHWPDQKKVHIEVWNVEDPLAPEVEGVVRMPKLKLSWTLIAPDENTTDATYQVHADPGGALPHWIVNLVSKELPFKTLTNLRKQVTKDGYDENLALVEVAFDWDAFWKSRAEGR